VSVAHAAAGWDAVILSYLGSEAPNRSGRYGRCVRGSRSPRTLEPPAAGGTGGPRRAAGHERAPPGLPNPGGASLL
jgi:hypothetical protein